MVMIETDREFTFELEYERYQFFGGKVGFNERGSFVVDAFTTPPAPQRGRYFAVLPIATVGYRRKSPTKTAYRVDGDTITVYCDWGRPHQITATSEVVAALVADLIANEVPEAVAPSQA
jgi:hypothetical protein